VIAGAEEVGEVPWGSGGVHEGRALHGGGREQGRGGGQDQVVHLQGSATPHATATQSLTNGESSIHHIIITSLLLLVL
jgi:hypothetical protein